MSTLALPKEIEGYNITNERKKAVSSSSSKDAKEKFEEMEGI